MRPFKKHCNEGLLDATNSALELRVGGFWMVLGLLAGWGVGEFHFSLGRCKL